MPESHDHDRGLTFDLSTLGRRQVLRLMAGAGLVTLIGCGSGSDRTSSNSSTASPSSTTAGQADGSTTTTAGAPGGSCTTIPEETAGPFPGDGSNGPNILTESGIVRSDIRSSFGDSTGQAEGVPLAVNLTIRDTANGCTPLAGAAVYVWHCDRDGLYSMYSEGAADQNYLRGVQETDRNGRVSFSSIFPAAYSGRWPHIHFEVYPSLDEATSAGGVTATSQLALPAGACEAVYATDGYEQSVRTFAQTSLESDMVFADGSATQLATMTGDANAGFIAALDVPV